MPYDPSLMAHADRRMRLAGRAILEDNGNPFFAPLDQLRAEARQRGADLISFANYDYLGLADHPAIRNAARTALDKIGVGALGSRLVGGERLIHADFEDSLAKFVGADACLTLVSGYLTNLTTIAHLMGRRDLIVYDELSHNSIVAGVTACKAEAIELRHNDMDHLESVLKEARSNHRNCLIVVESLYSMDGDIADLPAILSLKENTAAGCWSTKPTRSAFSASTGAASASTTARIRGALTSLSARCRRPSYRAAASSARREPSWIGCAIRCPASCTAWACRR